MFNTPKSGTSAATIEASMRELAASNDTWFDNTIESVDRRIAKVNRVRSSMRGALAAGEGDQYITDAHAMDKVAVELGHLRTALLESSLGLEMPKLARGSHEEIMALPIQAKQFVEVDSARFLEANADAVGDPLEMSIRAHGHAVVASSAMTDLNYRERDVVIAHFTDTVMRKSTAKQASAPKTLVASTVNTDDFADDLLWS